MKDKRRKGSEILIQRHSPSCPIVAVVEQDESLAYFYLFSTNESSPFGMKSCWVRNLVTAPEGRDVEAMEKNLPPVLSAPYCKFPKGQKPLAAENLAIVWLEEGDGAALLENGEILTIIPSWSDFKRFMGYARDCKGDSSLCWELTEENVLHERIEKAQQYWKLWNTETHPFTKLQPQTLAIYEKEWGVESKYFAIDGGNWPPKGLYVNEHNAHTIFATLGVSIVPQPQVELYYDEPNNFNRFELALKIKTANLADNGINPIGSNISGTTTIPWNNITWLGEGHTINFEGFNHPNFKAAILTQKLEVLPAISLADYRESKVNIFWLIPITDAERNFAEEHGSDALLVALNMIGEVVFDLARKSLR